MKKTKKIAALRRLPRQERGQQRIDAILNAAAQLFARIGFEETSTNAISRRAKTSIGSLYQFFPNKAAILKAVADRMLTDLRTLHDRVMTEELAHVPLPEVYDRVIDSLSAFHEQHPAFRALFFGSATSKELAAAAEQFHCECIARVDRLMEMRHPELPTEMRHMCATLDVSVIKAILPIAAEATPENRRELIAQLKQMLLAHKKEVFGDEIERVTDTVEPRQLNSLDT